VVRPKWTTLNRGTSLIRKRTPRQVRQRLAIDKMDWALRHTPCFEGDPTKMVVDFNFLPALPGDDSGVQRYTFFIYRVSPIWLFPAPKLTDLHCESSVSTYEKSNSPRCPLLLSICEDASGSQRNTVFLSRFRAKWEHLDRF